MRGVILIIFTILNAILGSAYCAKIVKTWSYKVDKNIITVDIKDDLIAFSTEDKVYLINKTKVVKELDYSDIRSIKFYKNGILIGDYDTLYFINYSGDAIWSRRIGDVVRDIDVSGNTIAVASNKKCFVLNDRGRITNVYDAESIVTGVSVHDGRIIYGDARGGLYIDNNPVLNLSRYISDVESYGDYVLVGFGALLRAIYGRGVLIWEVPMVGYIEDIDVYGKYILVVTEEQLALYKGKKRADSIDIKGASAGSIYGDKIVIAHGNTLRLYKIVEGPKIIIKSPKNGSKAQTIKIDVETDIPSRIDVFIDGKRFPLYLDILRYGEGLHEIEIVAVDKYGNKNKTKIYVYAVKEEKRTEYHEKRIKEPKENANKTIAEGEHEKSKFNKKFLFVVIVIFVALLIFFNVKNGRKRRSIRRYKFKRRRI